MSSFTKHCSKKDSALILSKNKEKKEWKKPDIYILDFKETKGGAVPVGFEGPFNFFFGS